MLDAMEEESVSRDSLWIQSAFIRAHPPYNYTTRSPQVFHATVIELQLQ
jgi:hypothetical protein